jgi:tripartite-type tricarboxylate transporter receptor subunit TctC
MVFSRGNAMKLPRREFLRLAAGAATLPVVSRLASAQTYPSRPARLIVGFPPGGAGDISARLEGQWLTQRLGQRFVIENKSGAGGNLGTELVVRSAPDGYTLFLVNTANAINASLYDKLNFDFLRDIAPVGGIMRAPNVMEVNPSFPARTVPEFIAYARANPGKINFASAGNGTLTHESAELFKMMTGIDMVHVPYRGSAPAITALLAGEAHVMFDNIPSSIEHIRAGKLRALAMTTAVRSEALPDVPVLADFVPGYEASGWYGVGAPRQTPPEIVDTLNREINGGSADPGMRTRFADLGCMMLTGSPADFAKLIAADAEKWAKVIKFSGAKAD